MASATGDAAPADAAARGMAAVPREWRMGQQAFEARMPHHESIQALWETKWKIPCSKSVYPFHDGLLKDFAPIFEHLIRDNIQDVHSAAYTEAFFPAAEALTNEASMLRGEAAANSGTSAARAARAGASALLLRACCLYRIARFPYIAAAHKDEDPAKWRAWEAQKAAYLMATKTWDVPLQEIRIRHTHGLPGEGGTIPLYLRVPPATAARRGPVPVVLLLTGLDGYRPDNTGRSDAFLARGWASVTLEIPGTADCPADAADPTSSERLWDSLFAWLDTLPHLDLTRVAVWGLSAGGYHAVRMAHTHAARLTGAVAQGAGVHHFFDPAWLARADGHEYPFRLLPALAAKHGFPATDDGVAAYVAGAQAKFSLLTNGILERPSKRLLLVNGTHDGLMPIEDSLLLFEHGSPKEGRFFPAALHMGYPLANESVYSWLEALLH